MKYIHQILLIFLFSFLGEVLHHLIPFPIPASIYGMVLLFLALSLGLVKTSAVSDAGNFLTGILPLLFVAPAVNLLDCWSLLKDHLIPVALIIVITTVLTFALSGWVTQGLVFRKGGRHD